MQDCYLEILKHSLQNAFDLNNANSCAITDASTFQLSALRNSPPLTPIIPPGAAKAFNELSSINKTLSIYHLLDCIQKVYISNALYNQKRGV